MCRLHARQVDTDEKGFPVDQLREWKATAEKDAFEALTTGRLALPEGILAVDAEVLERLGLKDVEIERRTERLRVAARTDVDAFKALRSWPVHAVELNFKTFNGDAPSFGVETCATALESSGEITIVASPGTGKSTACIQLVEALLSGR